MVIGWSAELLHTILTYAQHPVMLVIWGRESWFCPSRGWCLPAMSIGGSEWRASYKIGLLFPVRTGWFQVTITRICSLYTYYLELDLGLGILGAFCRRNPSLHNSLPLPLHSLIMADPETPTKPKESVPSTSSPTSGTTS